MFFSFCDELRNGSVSEVFEISQDLSKRDPFKNVITLHELKYF